MTEVHPKFYDPKPGQLLPANVYRLPACVNAEWDQLNDWLWVHEESVPEGVYYVPQGAEGVEDGPCGAQPSSPRWVNKRELPDPNVPVFEVGGKRQVGGGLHQGSWLRRETNKPRV